MSIPSDLARAAKAKGLRVEECGSVGHFKIVGGSCVVNYWPLSKRRSAHVEGTTDRARVRVSPQEAVEMAFGPAPKAAWKPKAGVFDLPAKRSPDEWVALLPHMRFAFKKRELQERFGGVTKEEYEEN